MTTNWDDLAELTQAKQVQETANNLLLIDGVNLAFRYLQRKNYNNFTDDYIRTIGETNVKRITINDNDDTPNYYIDRNSTIVDIKPSNYDENITIYKIVNNHNYFKSQFARIKPFLWSKSRFIISEYIWPFNEKVVKCNTDSIISTEILEGIKTGHNLGDLVYEGHYEHVKIINNAKEKGEFIKVK